MYRFRVLMILTALLASATFANAQSVSSAALRALYEPRPITPSEAPTSPYYLGGQAPQYFPPAQPLPRELASLEEAAKAYAAQTSDDEQLWLVRAANHLMAACQTLLNQTRAKSDGACCKEICGVKGVVKPADCCVGSDAGVCKAQSSAGPRTGSLMLGSGLNANHGVVSGIAIGSGAHGTPGYRVYVMPSATIRRVTNENPSKTPILDCFAEEFHDGFVWVVWHGHSARKGDVLLRPWRSTDDFVKFLSSPPDALTVSAPCCCAKACACCESCKAAKSTQVQVRPMMPPCVLPNPGQGQAGTPCPWTVQGPPTVWAGPMPMPMVPGVPVSMPKARPAHFVTPDFDAHCECIIHRGDSVTLEGNVLLLCKKHAQPVRIEGQSIVINLKDGSFTVDANLPRGPVATPVSNSAPGFPGHFVPSGGMTSTYDMPYPPAQRIIQVLPVPNREPTPSERPR